MTALHVVVLAAGKGTRMKSSMPKVMHPVGGMPLLGHVVRVAQALNAADIAVVLGHGIEQTGPYVHSLGATTVEQTAQLGTGHALQQALPRIPDDDGVVLVLYGDVPLVSGDTLRALLAERPADGLALLTTQLPDPTGYGRVLRDADGKVCGIVEQKDADTAQRAIREVNTGIMAVPNRFLHQALPRLSRHNAQGEYYLTDLIAVAVEAGRAVAAVGCDAEETLGVNDRAQLATVERLFQRRIAARLMHEGVTLPDPARLDVRGELTCGNDTTIDINVLIEGRVRIGRHCHIGANVVLKDCDIADGVEVRPFTHIDGAVIAEGCIIGPYARLRPGTCLASGVHIGNFVETKKAAIGAGSKANHLAYLGDAVIGSHVNVGAGTITCNYDGVNKFETCIGDEAFIGSNSSLVAPVSVGAGATVGAGSVITRDVPDGQLGVARGKQRNIDGWSRPQKRKD